MPQLKSLTELTGSSTPQPLVSIAPLVPSSPDEWASTGVRSKPPGCQSCQFRPNGAGFVPDWYPARDGIKPRLAFLLDFPSSDDVVENRPWAGNAGYAWERMYLKPLGLTLGDVMVSHVLRCQPKEMRFGRHLYPTGTVRRTAEIRCRAHDGTCWGGDSYRIGGIHTYDPNLFFITFHPYDAMETPALRWLIESDLRRALKKADEGYRPLVLMGKEAKELVAPWASGAVKSWRGHFWEGSWPWAEGSALTVPEFYEA